MIPGLGEFNVNPGGISARPAGKRASPAFRQASALSYISPKAREDFLGDRLRNIPIGLDFQIGREISLLPAHVAR